MNVVLIEDEKLAAQGLWEQIQRLRPRAKCLAVLPSVSDAVDWFRSANQLPDLGFFDIQLGDGLSFDIGEQVELSFPIVFTTAYDQYALRAFEWHSIDYLLKPVEPRRLAKAIEKWEVQRAATPDQGLWQELAGMLRQKPTYKDRFLVRKGDSLLPVALDQVAYFYSEHKVTWMVLRVAGHKHAVNYTLEQLEQMLDPSLFFRLNRSCFSSLGAVRSLTVYSGSRLKAILQPHDRTEVVSRDRVADIKEWLGQ